MLILLFAPALFAQVLPSPLLEGDCGPLRPAYSPARPLPAYGGLEIRENNGVYFLSMIDPLYNSHRRAEIAWNASALQNQATFPNGEVWRITGNAGNLQVRIFDHVADCAPLAPAAAPPSRDRIDDIWKAVREISGGTCADEVTEESTDVIPPPAAP